jgi:exodeoxyribonuclease V beta subunit
VTATQAYEEFDVCGPLPSGMTLLEASAGTGKTHTVATLAARYVAEGIPLERLLMITFTRMATGELRDRVRERLVASERDASGLRRERLARAVANFDAATIATTHGFCQEVLAELGTVSDLDPDTEFVEDVSELLEEALDDLYVRRFWSRGEATFSRAEALRIARTAVFSPTARLEPSDEPRESAAAMRFRLAEVVRREVEQRKRRLAVITYDDLLTRLNATLAGPTGEIARARLRARYEVVLVDEFQDTDPIQWQILYRAFGSGVTLVLIADPKQAIYAFRGADVYAYLVAAQMADTRATLRVNRRSDQRLLDAYDALFGNARLGDDGIVYRQVRAADATPGATGALRIRVLHRGDVELTPTGYAKAPSARAHVARDVAADIVERLRSGSGRPGDIAVLVRTHRTADLIRRELRAARVPAVINGAGSVFATEAAQSWLRLLDALERPSSTVRAHTAALTPFLGWSAERIAGAPEDEWEAVHRRLHRWGRILGESGVAAMLEEIVVGEDLAARMLAVDEGERAITDIRHVAQLLHGAASAQRPGVTALRAWLGERIAGAEREDAEEEPTRRLESDAEAVQVLTIHRSKGIEFPIVYCPFLWEPSFISRDPEPVLFHDPVLTVDVGLEGRRWAKHLRQQLVEQRGEDLRLLYVALTRAKHQAVMWWAGSYDSRHSPLGRLLFFRDESGNVAPEGGSTPTDDAAWERFAELADGADGCISVERSTLGVPTTWSPPLEPPEELVAARLHRGLDRRWRRTSYSDITSESREDPVTSEPEQPSLTDEPEIAAGLVVAAPIDRRPGLDRVSPLGGMPIGVEFGTFVHAVLESTDFAAADLDAELDGRDAAELRAAIETPLGDVAGGVRLRDVARANRLDELAFELPLVGGDDPTGRLTLSAIAEVLRRRLPRDDPMAGYAARLEDPALRSTVRGFLTGSIDLVARLEGPRFAVVDYKTNWLGPPDEPLTLGHYQPGALAVEMNRSHYGLQALLYAVALHRYLRWRLPGYDPERHLAGVLYLFLRGMAGPETPVVDGTPCGVFAWRPPAAMVGELSDVLDRGG